MSPVTTSKTAGPAGCVVVELAGGLVVGVVLVDVVLVDVVLVDVVDEDIDVAAVVVVEGTVVVVEVVVVAIVVVVSAGDVVDGAATTVDVVSSPAPPAHAATARQHTVNAIERRRIPTSMKSADPTPDPADRAAISEAD